MDLTTVGEHEATDPMCRRHRCAPDLDKGSRDARAGRVPRPDAVAYSQVFDGDVARRRRDPCPAGEADRAGRRSARGPACDGHAPALVDRAVDASALLRRGGSEDREEVESAAHLLETELVEHLPVAVDRELLLGRVARGRRDAEMRKERAEGRSILLDVWQSLVRQ